MHKTLANILSAFVPSKERRHEFRTKILGRPTFAERAVFNIESGTPEQKIAALIYRCFACAALHPKTFGEYRNIFTGREVVLIAAGPTANSYVPIENAVHVGCNRSFMLESVSLDFLFLADFRGISSFVQEFIDYQGNSCVKFLADLMGHQGLQIPESFFLKLSNAKKYIAAHGQGEWGDIIPVDIALHPLWSSTSVAHHAFQFILFTNPKKIYMVGCDCTSHLGGHCVAGCNDQAIKTSQSQNKWNLSASEMITGWKKLKDFAALYYPETEIISINPVGLKGLFVDIFYPNNQ